MNWKQAFALGLCSVGEYKGEPVAHLYNGTQLPALPEWDKETYPYALIVWNKNNSEYMLLLQDSKETVDADGEYMLFYESGIFYRANNGAWEIASADSYDAVKPIWANYDILDSNGSVYLAASDPIPVYA